MTGPGCPRYRPRWRTGFTAPAQQRPVSVGCMPSVDAAPPCAAPAHPPPGRRRVGGRRAGRRPGRLGGLAGRAAWTTSDERITVLSGPGRHRAGRPGHPLLPAPGPLPARFPAVLLAHGFGGTKESVRADAESLAERGYAVLTWTARGFGRSGGQIHLDSPDYEVTDAQRLLDWLAARPRGAHRRRRRPPGRRGRRLVRRRRWRCCWPAQDPRVDAIVPLITWNDLGRVVPAAVAGGDRGDGRVQEGLGRAVLRQRRRRLRPTGASPAGDPPGAAHRGIDPACGRFAADVCAAYLRDRHHRRRRTPAAVALLRRSSPAAVLDQIKAPTLLIQGAADTLFPLSEADANARGIAADRHAGPGRLVHRRARRRRRPADRPGPDQVPDRAVARPLRQGRRATRPSTSFTYSRVAGFSALDRGLVTNGYSDPTYPGPDRDRPHATVTVSRPGAADRQPAERQPGRALLAARRRRPARLAARRRGRRHPRPARRVRLGAADRRDRRGRRADRAAPGRVADRRGGAVRQALRRRPGRRRDAASAAWSRRSG